MIYLFKYVNIHQNGLYGFFSGFGWSMLSFFPNFWSSKVPASYVEVTNYPSLVPDANLVRNGGFIYSFEVILIGLMIVCFSVAYYLYKSSDLH